MNLKKILTGALIGAFVFGISASSIQPVSAASAKEVKTTLDNAKEKFDRNSSDKNNPPEPPKDSNGKPLPPPDKDSNGKTTLDNAKNKYDNAKDKYKDAKKIADKVK